MAVRKNLRNSYRERALSNLVAEAGKTPLQIITTMSYLCPSEMVQVRYPLFYFSEKI